MSSLRKFWEQILGRKLLQVLQWLVLLHSFKRSVHMRKAPCMQEARRLRASSTHFQLPYMHIVASRLSATNYRTIMQLGQVDTARGVL